MINAYLYSKNKVDNSKNRRYLQLSSENLISAKNNMLIVEEVLIKEAGMLIIPVKRIFGTVSESVLDKKNTKGVNYHMEHFSFGVSKEIRNIRIEPDKISTSKNDQQIVLNYANKTLVIKITTISLKIIAHDPEKPIQQKLPKEQAKTLYFDDLAQFTVQSEGLNLISPNYELLLFASKESNKNTAIYWYDEEYNFFTPIIEKRNKVVSILPLLNQKSDNIHLFYKMNNYPDCDSEAPIVLKLSFVQQECHTFIWDDLIFLPPQKDYKNNWKPKRNLLADALRFRTFS